MPEVLLVVRIVYLHGFASGPRSAKATALAPRLEQRGLAFDAPDLNLPSFERLRVSAQIRHVEELVSRSRDPVILVGSSLGGLVALHAQANRDEVAGVVVLAPALEADQRWLQLIGGEAGLQAWRASGTRPFHHHAYGREVPVDVGFLDDLLAHARPPRLRVLAEIVQGLEDDQVPPDTARRFLAREPDRARLTLVDDDHGLLRPTSLDEIVRAVERVRASV